MTNKPPLLLLHGAIGSSKQFDAFLPCLESEFELFTLNFSGHGGIPIPAEDFTIQLFAHDVISFLQKNNLAPVDILGYSMGGYVALYLARHFPKYIGRIMALSTKFDWNEISSAKETKLLIPEKIEEKIPAFAQVLAQRHQPQDWKLVLRKTATMMQNMGMSPTLSTEDYRQIRHSSLLAVGKEDKMISENETRSVAALLPQAKFLVLEDTPHPIEQMNPAKICQEVKAFFGVSAS